MAQYVQSAYLKAKNCDWKDGNIPKKKIIVPFRIYALLIYLLDSIDTEFLGYFYAEEREDGSWAVDDFYLPEQEVTAGTCLATEEILGVQGVFHSHVGMGTFMSPTDDNHINANHDFSIVGNKKREFKGVTREFLPCDAITYVDADLILLDEQTYLDYDKQIAIKVKPKVVTTPPVTRTTTPSPAYKSTTPAETTPTQSASATENPTPTTGEVKKTTEKDNAIADEMDKGLFDR